MAKPGGLDILVGMPAEDDEVVEEQETEPTKAPDQDAIISEIRMLLDKLQPAVDSLG